MVKVRFLAAVAFAALVLAAGVASGAPGETPQSDCWLTCSKCVFIDMFDSAHTVAAPPGAPYHLPDINSGNGETVGMLVAGKRYLVTVSGWVSYWFPSLWEAFAPVGIPIEPPKHYSDGPGAPPIAEQTHTGYDWKCLFAYPGSPWSPVLPLPAPYSQDRVSVDGGVTWLDPMPLSGQACAPDHTYRFILVGQGQYAYFRISDTGPTYDNYGKYRICVREICCSTESDCDDLVSPGSSPLTIPGSNVIFDPRLITAPPER